MHILQYQIVVTEVYNDITITKVLSDIYILQQNSLFILSIMNSYI